MSNASSVRSNSGKKRAQQRDWAALILLFSALRRTFGGEGGGGGKGGMEEGKKKEGGGKGSGAFFTMQLWRRFRRSFTKQKKQAGLGLEVEKEERGGEGGTCLVFSNPGPTGRGERLHI